MVIPSRDGAARLPETLGSVASQDVGGPVEVVVVDDGSADATAETAAAAPLPWGAPRIVRHGASRGRAAARNTGLREARAAVVVLLDDDMTLLPGALETHRAHHDGSPGSVALGRVVLADPPRETGFSRFLLREEREREQALLEHAGDVPFRLCFTGHLSADRAALVRAGGFDESIARYGFEDIDLGYRLRERGVPVRYLPEARSVHRAFMTDLDRYLARHREAGRVARQLAARHPAGPFREYLRVDAPARLGIGNAPAGLVALRLAHLLLRSRAARRALGSRPAGAAGRLALRGAEALGLERLVHFGYHVARDVRYFQGCFDDPPEGSPQ